MQNFYENFIQDIAQEIELDARNFYHLIFLRTFIDFPIH